MSRERVRKPHHFFFWFLGVIFGFLLTVGLIAFGVYWAYSSVNLQKVEKTFGVNLSDIPDDIKTKTIKDIIPMISETSNLTVAEFCDRYDINISFKVEVGEDEHGTALYVDFEEAFRPMLDAKLTEAFGKISDVKDYFTIKNTFDLLAQANEFPDFNFLHDARYKDQPIQNIASMLDDFTIADFMETSVNLNDGLISHFKNMKLVELATDGGITDVINDIQIGEILNIDASIRGVMSSISTLKVGELNNTNVINAIGDLTLQEVLGIDDGVTGVMASLKDITINQIKNGDIDDEIKDLTLNDVLDIQETSGIMYELKDVRIGDLTADYIKNNITVATALGTTETTGILGVVGNWKLNQLTNTNINNINVGDALNIPATATGILGAIKDLTIGDLNSETNIQNAIKVLKISDVLSLPTTNKIFSAIKDLKLEELTDTNIQDAISTLKVEDIIGGTSSNTTKLWGVIKNSTIGNIDSTIQNLKLSQVVEYNNATNDGYTGLLGYLIDENNNKDPLISNLSTAIDNAIKSYVQNETIDDLVNAGVLDASYRTYSNYNVIKDKTIIDIIEDALGI